jgi:hypothetical protein
MQWRFLIALLAAAVVGKVWAGDGRDIQFFVLVKSSNYAQASDGNLSLLNYHFFSEVFPAPQGEILGALAPEGDDGH